MVLGFADFPFFLTVHRLLLPDFVRYKGCGQMNEPLTGQERFQLSSGILVLKERISVKPDFICAPDSKSSWRGLDAPDQSGAHLK